MVAPTLEQLETARAKAKASMVCQCCGTGNCKKLWTCAGCLMTRYCSRKCQKHHWVRHIRDCWFAIRCIDLAGGHQAIGPVHCSTQVAMVRSAAAAWKKVSLHQIELVFQRNRLDDRDTMRGAGISEGCSVTVVVTPLVALAHFNEVLTAWMLGVPRRTACRCQWCQIWHIGGAMEEVD